MNRQQIKLDMMRDRTDRRGCWCDLCHQPYDPPIVEMHELIPRRKTMSNQEARALSFQPELCAILCPGCHDEAETESNERRLWEANVNRYGAAAVQAALNRLLAIHPITMEVL